MKLSVAMITYNQEGYIAQALESVLAQKVDFQYEIVIGEDCSTDGTRDIVRDFQRRYPERITPLMRPGNLGAMRNFAETLAACRGQYVAFLEGDDYWTRGDKLQRQLDFLDANPDCALCCHRVKYLTETGTSAVDVYPLLAAGTYAIEDLLRMNFVPTCSTVVRRNLVPIFPEWLFTLKMGDWPLFVMVARHGKIELMDEIMATYRVHSGGTWTSLPRMTQLREVTRMLRLLDEHMDFHHTKAIRQALGPLFLDMAISARANCKRVETAKQIIRCLQNGGLRSRANWRPLAGLVAYALMGTGYRFFSKAKSANGK